MILGLVTFLVNDIHAAWRDYPSYGQTLFLIRSLLVFVNFLMLHMDRNLFAMGEIIAD